MSLNHLKHQPDLSDIQLWQPTENPSSIRRVEVQHGSLFRRIGRPSRGRVMEQRDPLLHFLVTLTWIWSFLVIHIMYEFT